MIRGYMFFFNLGNISMRARILMLPLFVLCFLSILFSTGPVFVTMSIAFVGSVVLSLVPAPSDKRMLDTIDKFYSDFISYTCRDAGVEQEELAFLKTWQLVGKMQLKRYVNNSFIYPYACIMSIYSKDNEQYLALSVKCLLKEENVRRFKCRISDEALKISVSPIQGTDGEVSLNILFPGESEEICCILENTYQNRELSEILINKCGDISLSTQGQGMRNNVEISDITPVSRARAYGVTKHETALTRFNDVFSHFLFVSLKIFAFVVLAVYIWFLLTLMGTIGIALYYVGLFCFLWFVVLRPYKKRFKFFRRLKRYCKKSGYSLNIKRKFFDTFKYADRGCDLELECEDCVYFVRLLTVKKKNCDIMFDGKNHAQIITPCPRDDRAVSFYDREIYEAGKYSVRTYETRGFGRMKIHLFDVNFKEEFSAPEGKRAVKMLVVDPVPRAIHKKERDGGTGRTGTGDRIEDFVLYTADNFIDFLKRK